MKELIEALRSHNRLLDQTGPNPQFWRDADQLEASEERLESKLNEIIDGRIKEILKTANINVNIGVEDEPCDCTYEHEPWCSGKKR